MEEIKSAQMKYIGILQDLIAKQEMEINELKEKLSEASRPASSEVKHGHWIRKKPNLGAVWCSECDRAFDGDSNFCPNCGSRNEDIQ